ncbi:Mitochondrial import inner membrane translocase subunit [Collichthys lucidus]|uniref:Mitochondrial import inner membrane translocase subunit Tim10 B n=1 Tax=Collichthys lucidus TaxID=240159 RepID=A0A4U5V8E8_COLLU|nr:Mitochondrial import inner membrane translocase subunit [Collichthys lucidus]
MDPDQQLRNLRDFLLVYNRMTEICFQRCSSNFNYRNLTMDEENCVDNCAGKLIRSNHRLMGTYVQLMPRMVQRRMEELESKAAENAKAAEAAAAANAAPPATEAVPAFITSSPPPELPPPLPSSLTEVGPEAHGSFLKPAGLDIPVDSQYIKGTDVKLSAAAALTPAAEAVKPSVFNEAGNGPSSTAGFPQAPISGAQIEFKPASLSADVPVPTIAAPTVSKPMESPSGHEKASEPPPPSSQ